MRTAAATLSVALAVVTIAVGAACTSPADEAPPEAPTTAQIADLFNQWNATLATGDAQAVAALYAPDAVLLPTVSNVVRTDHTGIVDYFDHFLPSKPSAVIEQSKINILDPDSAIDTGVYKFTLQKEGVPQTVDARYTFVYEKRNDKWLIVNHHSSVLPEG